MPNTPLLDFGPYRNMGHDFYAFEDDPTVDAFEDIVRLQGDDMWTSYVVYPMPGCTRC